MLYKDWQTLLQLSKEAAILSKLHEHGDSLATRLLASLEQGNRERGGGMKHNSPDNTLSTLIKFYKNIFCQILTYNAILSGSSSQAIPAPPPANLIRLSRRGNVT